jgi:hypothetical protein
MKARANLSLSALALSLGLVAALPPTPSAIAAPSRSTCFQTYGSCVDWASNLPDWVGRSLAGMDCYVDLVHCVKDAIW